VTRVILPHFSLAAILRFMVTDDFVRVVQILPFDSMGNGGVFLALYEGKDPVEISAIEAKALVQSAEATRAETLNS
jgi:hypothetical protein